MEGDQSPQKLDTRPLTAPRKLPLPWLLYPKVVLYVNGLQQYAQKFGLSLLILCLWYGFILNMSNISVVLLYSPVWTCSGIFYYWWAFGRFFDSGYCEWYHSEHSSACLLRSMHGIPGTSRGMNTANESFPKWFVSTASSSIETLRCFGPSPALGMSIWSILAALLGV